MNTPPINIDALQPGDRAAWGVLAHGYKAFYKTDIPEHDYDAAFARLLAGREVQAWVARRDGQVVGIVHYLFHASAWMADACYLQDLFVSEQLRGQGIAAALIERVAQSARQRGASRLYWLTQDDNARARALYDRVAQYKGFIRYDFPL